MMANLKGSKNKPSNLLDFAEACRLLINKWGIKEMSKYFRTSEYMLRQIDKINDLKNPKLKKLIQDGKLGIEASYQLWRLNESKRLEVIEIIEKMTTKEIREFVYFLHKNPDMSIFECKKLFDKTQPEKIRILALPLDSQTYESLKESADKSKLKIHDYALKILERHLYGKIKKKN